MFKKIFFLSAIVGILMLNMFSSASANEVLSFRPIEHATFVIKASNVTIYVDPVGSIDDYEGLSRPDIILITDIHYDHLAPDIVNALKSEETIVIGPKAVIDQLGAGEVLNNGQSGQYKGINLEAIPMYNLTPERMQFHQKGRGNGYVLTVDEKRIYVSGDTEDIKEMRELKDIDYAFVCMNLPYTMTVEQAASAVLEFRPKVVFPYHYRGKDMVSDIDLFKKLISSDKEIETRSLKWY